MTQGKPLTYIPQLNSAEFLENPNITLKKIAGSQRTKRQTILIGLSPSFQAVYPPQSVQHCLETIRWFSAPLSSLCHKLCFCLWSLTNLMVGSLLHK